MIRLSHLKGRWWFVVCGVLAVKTYPKAAKLLREKV